MILTPTIMVQNAQELSKILTLEGVTVAGILIIFCIFLGWQNHKKEKVILEKEKEIKNLYREMTDKYIEMTKKFEDSSKTHASAMKNLIDFLKI